MFEKDKKILNAFKECFANLQVSMAEGEEVDLSSACVEETEALVKYTSSHIAYYKDKNP